MSPLYPQSNSSSPNFHKQLSATSVALVCVFFCCFIAIVYLSAKAPRPATRVLPSSTVSRLIPRRRRPRLMEVWLDEPLGGTVHNWRPLAAWHDGGPAWGRPRQEMTANPHIALVQVWIGRRSTFVAERRGATQFSASSPPALPPGNVSDPRSLKVAVLVAMPRREDPRPVSGSTLDPRDRPGLFYDDGELELGVTSLLSEQAMSEEYEQTL